ncbi:fatty acid desaturase family protein [Rhizosaccharibacter radicis]|uniref:Fatty acid desaturase n=1 Tax=Rhizosaccharibacter radicis TaxID=2782605 RepID=A0ABT1W0T9_9PROT|nr:fatty acid desaturase [Acetobacteraceae bacterium KSS12]
MSTSVVPAGPAEAPDLASLKTYQKPSWRSAVWQLFTTFGLYLSTVAAAYVAARHSVLLVLLLSLPASGLIVRIFMLQHDCGHRSFVPSSRANSIIGSACSLVTWTPFAYWRRLHARHHGSWNNLDDRGIPADFFSDCLTLDEYRALGPFRKVLYRLTHHPMLMHVILPPVVFLLLYRLPFDMPASFRKERLSVGLLNLCLCAMFGALVWWFGWKTVLLVHLPAMILAAVIGIWLFSVQHRFEESQWATDENWNFSHAAIHGTSYLRLPRVLQWFSGNIGLHHIHHLRPGIPNYRLEACQRNCSDVADRATVLSLREAIRAPSFVLWDAELKRMVPFPT